MTPSMIAAFSMSGTTTKTSEGFRPRFLSVSQFWRMSMVASTSRTKEGALRMRRLTSFSSGSMGSSVLSILRMEF